MHQEKNHTSGRRGRAASLGRMLLNATLLLIAIAMTIAVLIGFWVTFYFDRNIDPEFDEQSETRAVSAGASRLYYYRFDDRAARRGERLELEGGTLDGGVYFIPVTYGEVPQTLIDAFVAIEDQQFWSHHGVNWPRTISAGMNYALGFTRQFGASTITQQLIKNLTGKSEVSVRRKVQEMCWANDLERCCTKEEIMERYLNVINLSRGCYGIGAAADRFFGKEVGELTLSECAAIAAITNNPSYYDPVRFPEHTRARRDLILSTMVSEGYLDETEARAAMAEPLILVEQPMRGESAVHSWYVDMVIEDVITDLCATYDYTREYAGRLLWNGGLTIETAVDPTLQEALEAYYSDVSHFGTGQSAMILLDPATGDVLAVAGAVGQKVGDRLLNYATAARHPAASAIKPLSLYAPALEAGEITWASVIDDVPVRYRTVGEEEVGWPQNADHLYRGRTDMQRAIARSVNTVAVRILQRLGMETSFSYLHDTLGMTSLIRSQTLSDGRSISDCGEAALALGQMNYGVTLRELTAGYTALANGGVYMKPRSYFRVLAPDGRVLLSCPTEGNYALSEQNAYIMTKLLETVVTEGTGKGAALFGGAVAVSGKTGTSGAAKDRYFIGYTPDYLAGVWYGTAALNDPPRGNPAVGIFRETMEAMLGSRFRTGELKTHFDDVGGVIRVSYCRDSGGCPSAACQADLRGGRIGDGYFVVGTEPHDACECHVLTDYDMARRCPADDQTAAQDRRRVGLLRIRRELPEGIYVTDERCLFPE